MSRQEILGIPYDTLNKSETIKFISDSIKGCGSQIYRSDINAASFLMLKECGVIKDYICGADVINIDGMGVIFGCKFLGNKNIERIAGADLFEDILSIAEKNCFSVYFLGSTQEVVTMTAKKALIHFPNLSIAGFGDGYFQEKQAEVVEVINDSNPDILFVGVKSPEKEKFILEWRGSLDVKFIMGVGGTFDVFSGNIKRAPSWVQKIGMEWFFRFIQEPKRMWRRYFFSNIYFLRLITQEKFRLLKCKYFDGAPD